MCKNTYPRWFIAALFITRNTRNNVNAQQLGCGSVHLCVTYEKWYLKKMRQTFMNGHYQEV